MEKSPHHHDQDSSRSSSSTDQEVDQPPDYVAAGRFYECVFCKRGFTTAQALGGHMNIHRKDRAKNRPTPLINSNQNQQINNYHAAPNRSYGHPVSGYVPQPNYYPSAAAAHDGQQLGNYPTYFPESTSAGAGYGGGEICERIPQFGDDWRVSLSLQFGAAEREKAEEDKDDEVDLELRLGYNR